ncbi:hypothetical protein C1645_818342 [Glomus cerebriforme]|uniref:Uncharacterized protein n=1 Tax=Glomus cerebriforme TaxID=658196 RepID=A0A397TBA9_9GLOM|nr:hypothetical protein C1645_818342 [Glomus cerebriforme]
MDVGFCILWITVVSWFIVRFSLAFSTKENGNVGYEFSKAQRTIAGKWEDIVDTFLILFVNMFSFA